MSCTAIAEWKQLRRIAAGLTSLCVVGLLSGLTQGCASTPPDQVWRDAAPDAGVRMGGHSTQAPEAPASGNIEEAGSAYPSAALPALRIGVATLLNVDLQQIGPCDSCHGASANFWEFEYDQKLDSVARELWPQAMVVRLVPGVDPVAESDTLLDLWTAELGQWSGVVAEACQGVDTTLVAFGFHPPPAVRSRAAALGVRYGLDLLLLPGPTAVRLYPEKGQPQGRVQISHHFSLWDLRRAVPLYRSCQTREWRSRGSEQIDRQTTPLVLMPISVDLRRLLADKTGLGLAEPR